MAYDGKLAELMRAALGTRAGVEERKMFGGICWTLNGNMLCGVEGKRYMLRIGKEAEKRALARKGAAPMDFTGRPLGGLVWVRGDAALEAGLETWLVLAERFVGALPRKRPKRR